MTRSSALLCGLTLGLLWLAPACDGGGGDDSTGGDAETSGTATDTDTDTDGPQECGTEWAEKSGTGTSVMDEYGAPCMQDADCVAILGDDGVCINDILGVYQLPGGYCSKYCTLPDSATSFVHDSPDCSADGGVTCIGANGLFTACAVPCETSDECGREGYGCRTMPTLAAEGDPTFCLMNPTDCCTTDSGECAP